MIQKAAKGGLSIPMWIDDVKKIGHFKMTRLSYFVAEADEPIDDWVLMLGKTDVPVIIYGLTAAICQPSRSKERFESVDDLEMLFDRVEAKGALSIETPDLWLPNELLGLKPPPKRGNVYRVGQKLFTAALRFRTSRTNEQEFREECMKARTKPRFSPKETEVFAAWNVMQVDLARTSYEANKASGCYMEYSEAGSATKD
ncbi:MAG: hypothetical protein ABIF87_09000 [Pseudomonadota bacterium]